MHGTYTVAMPNALMASRPTHAMYVRRRLVVLVFLVTLVLSIGLAARHGLADRGEGPASPSAVGRTSAGQLLADGTYLVQPGDTLWAIADRFAPAGAVADYVDALVSYNGGSVITPGQQLRLP